LSFEFWVLSFEWGSVRWFGNDIFYRKNLIFAQNKSFMTRKSFENWSTDDLRFEFGILKVAKIALLTEWLSAPNKITEDEKKRITELRESLENRILDWKEQEIIMHFIGPLLTLVNLDGDTFSGFASRKLSAKKGDWEISGLVDYMIATGKQNPRQPFFCFHEYKAERRRDSDPLGQVLTSMLAAQVNNQTEMPLFGAFINGRNWQFLVLDGTKYALSQAYDATQDDIFQIFSILRDLKARIQKLAEA
jgi:hypothetical protein